MSRFVCRGGTAVALQLTLTLLLATGCAEWLNSNVVNGYRDAHNAHSIEAMTSLFLEDATIRLPDPEQPVIEGIEHIEALAGWFVAVDSRVDWEIESTGDDVVRVGEIEQTSEWLRLLGVESVRWKAGTEFHLDGGLIRSIDVQWMTEESHRTVQRALQEFTGWLSMEDPALAAELLPVDYETFGPEAAQRWLATLRRYSETN